MSFKLLEEISNLTENFTLDDETDVDNSIILLPTHYLSHILLGVVGIIVCGVGVFTNLISIIILKKHSMNKLSTSVYLIALSICDAIGLLFTIIVLMQYSLEPGLAIPNFMITVYPKLLVYVYPIVITLQTLSVWIIFALTIDRYLCVCKPNIGRKFCTKKRSLNIVLVLLFLSIIYSLPTFFERNYKMINISSTKVILFSSLTSFGSSQTYFRIYHLYTYTIFICLIPFGTIAILNSFLIHNVIKFKRQKKHLKLNSLLNKNNNQDDEISLKRDDNLLINHTDITILLIGLVLVFFICQLPSTVLRLITYKHREIIFNPIYVTLMDISNFLIVINSTINCVLYTYTCTKIYPIYAVEFQ
jgi:hypothetical protein